MKSFITLSEVCPAMIPFGGAHNLADFFNDGSTYQQTIRENSSAFSKYRLRSRVLVDVSKLTTETKCFDRTVKFPLGVSPAGIQAMAHHDGELATSRACAKVGVNMAISSFSNYAVEEVISAGDGNVNYAMQLYPMKDRHLQEQIIKSAEAAGCKAIFLTGDSPVLGVRYNEWRDDFRTPKGLEFPILGWTTEVLQKRTHDSGFMSFNDDSHSWAKDIPWLRERTNMQIWVKGIVSSEDVELAIEHGCDGVLVSNHGGRQLDGVPATIDALVECVDAAKGRIPIHMDGGVRSGKDMFIALALGAQHVWVGRPVSSTILLVDEANVPGDLGAGIRWPEWRREDAEHDVRGFPADNGDVWMQDGGGYQAKLS
jgi:(S)-2-hydroxy-acid oxidase